MTIWKYEIGVTDEQTVMVPEGAEILCVQMQGTTPCLWALVNPKLKPAPRTIEIHGTGNPQAPETAAHYIGTFQQFGGRLVWHVFEKC